MKASDVSAVIVTRGNVSLNPILQSLPFDDVIVWDNSSREVGGRRDFAVYGRYLGIKEARNDVVFVQDDDCVLAPESFIELLDSYESGKLTANMPERFRPHYPDSCLIGFGAIFDKTRPDAAFDRFFDVHAGMPDYCDAAAEFCQTENNDWHERTLDVIFTALTPRILVDAPYHDLPWATADDRMYRQPSHVGERARMLDLARKVRGGKAA